jgi:ribosomal protein S7
MYRPDTLELTKTGEEDIEVLEDAIEHTDPGRRQLTRRDRIRCPDRTGRYP